MSEINSGTTQNGNICISSREMFNTRSGVAYINDVMPTHDSSEDIPLLISPGLLNSSDMLLPMLDEFAANGIRAIAVEHVRSGRKVEMPEFEEIANGYPRVEIGKAETLLRVMEHKRLGQADLLGYCEGAVNGAILAARYPERIRSFVLLNPAGMMGKDSFLRVARVLAGKSLNDMARGFSNLWANREKASENKHAGLVLDRLLGLPTLYHLSRTRIDGRLVELQAAGINVGVLQSYRDSLYPYGDVAQRVPDGITHASLADRRLGHAAIFTHQEVAVGAIVQLLKSIK